MAKNIKFGCIFIVEGNPVTQAASSLWSLGSLGWHLTGSYVFKLGSVAWIKRVQRWHVTEQSSGERHWCRWMGTHYSLTMRSSEMKGSWLLASPIERAILRFPSISAYFPVWDVSDSLKGCTKGQRSKLARLCSALGCSDSACLKINPVDERTFIFSLLKSN